MRCRRCGTDRPQPERHNALAGHECPGGEDEFAPAEAVPIGVPMQGSFWGSAPAAPTRLEPVAKAAGFSPCRTWRYWLTRTWNPTASKPLVVIGLNPSTANETQDDPTIRRCISFARAWGHGGLVMLNLFGFRSTDPAGLRATPDPVGPDNDRVLVERTAERRILCAWGANATEERTRAVLRFLSGDGRQLVCLATNKDGSPKHPLYAKGDLQPQPYGAGATT